MFGKNKKNLNLNDDGGEPLPIDNYLGDWTTNEGTYFYFEDGKWGWYESDNNVDDNYYSGTYEMRYGVDAINYLDLSLSDILSNIENSYWTINFNSYCSFELTVDKCVFNGEDITPSPTNSKMNMLVISVDYDYIKAIIFGNQNTILYLNRKNKNFVKRRTNKQLQDANKCQN